MLGAILDCVSTLFLEIESLNQTRSSLIWLLMLVILLWVLLSLLGLQLGFHAHPACVWVLASEFQFSHLQGKSTQSLSYASSLFLYSCL